MASPTRTFLEVEEFIAPADATTGAGVREVEITPYLRDELLTPATARG
ncbi:MAG: hypothetical protein WAN22_13245 [Solirubrobacteraceae bacterium]